MACFFVVRVENKTYLGACFQANSREVHSIEKTSIGGILEYVKNNNT